MGASVKLARRLTLGANLTLLQASFFAPGAPRSVSVGLKRSFNGL